MSENINQTEPEIVGLKHALYLKDIELQRAKLEAARNLRDYASAKVNLCKIDLAHAKMQSQETKFYNKFKQKIKDYRK